MRQRFIVLQPQALEQRQSGSHQWLEQRIFERQANYYRRAPGGGELDGIGADAVAPGRRRFPHPIFFAVG